MVETSVSRKLSWRSPRYWIPMLLVAGIGALVVWLNTGPWWGWLLVALAIVAVAALARLWRRRHPPLQVGAWVAAAALIVAVAVAAYPPLETRAADGAAATAAIVTEQGPVTGVVTSDGAVEVFAGVPYAAPPVGDLRWAPPQPAPHRSETLVADTFSAAPVQAESSFLLRAATRLLEIPLENTFLNPYPVSEDSLYLNIWRGSGTAPGADLPVLVFIPGGGFVSGSGALPLYDGASLASRGSAIIVTINYRMGVFGFLASEELSAESTSGSSGNQGILDQIAALQWVHDNIQAFGGDPGRVTVAGESAGSASVCVIGASPVAVGLVHRIIGESGGCLGTVGDADDGDQYDTEEEALAVGSQVTAALGGATLEEMREMSIGEIRAATSQFAAHWKPAIDGYVLPAGPAEIYSAGEQNDVPLLLGSNADESSLILAFPPDTDPAAYEAEVHATYGSDAERFLELYPGDTSAEVLDSRLRSQTDQVMTRAMRAWAVAAADSGSSGVFTYFFTRTPPDPGLEEFGAYHGSEVMYAYGNLGSEGAAVYTDVDERLTRDMSAYWLAFVAAGDPNHPGGPVWPSVQDEPDSVMELGDETRVVERPRAEAVDFWMAYTGPTA
jgi:para-nitrobenzyl esterase